jgi:hypothetical protein
VENMPDSERKKLRIIELGSIWGAQILIIIYRLAIGNPQQGKTLADSGYFLMGMGIAFAATPFFRWLLIQSLKNAPQLKNPRMMAWFRKMLLAFTPLFLVFFCYIVFFVLPAETREDAVQFQIMMPVFISGLVSQFFYFVGEERANRAKKSQIDSHGRP